MTDRHIHSCERLQLAALTGDDAAWAGAYLWGLVRRTRLIKRVDPDEALVREPVRVAEIERAARVLEFLWNDMGEVRRLVAEAAELFRAYEAHHLDIAKRTGAKTGREAKAQRNGHAAEKLERWLAGDDTSPAAVMRDYSERFATRPGYGEEAEPLPVVYGGYGEAALRIAEQDQAALRSNVKPVTSGPLADFEVVGGVMAALDGDTLSFSVADKAAFRLQTPDPRFDPAKPVRVNGYLYHPATEDLCKTN